MDTKQFTRRHLLQSSAVFGTAGLVGLADSESAEAAPRVGKTPPLSTGEIAAIETALGKKGMYVEAQATHTTPLPRNDLKMTVQGDGVPIAFGFGGWVSVKKTLDGRSAVLMGDTVLLQEEVNPLMAAAHANGLEVSALHNHFFYEDPRIFFMHVHGMGSVSDVIQRYAAAVKTTNLFPGNQPPAGPPPARLGSDRFDVPGLDEIVKGKAAINGPSIKYTIGRPDLNVIAMGAEITAAIGLNSWAAFAGERDSAHICGDIAMLEPELNPVIRTLHQNNLNVVSVHNHMIGEQPRMMFLHYYGSGPTTALAQGFRAALNELGKHGKTLNMKATKYHLNKSGRPCQDPTVLA